ncbi:hypothetical protein [Saccharopolyspora shandongensis]|uniref:hypothetical protein n=1 Tax=Saccharopolyspora shandongensis TaxID=418495 RepID=UPI003F4DB47D
MCGSRPPAKDSSGPAREALAAAERARSEALARSGEVRGSLVIGTITPEIPSPP